MPPFRDITGQKFHKLTVLAVGPKNKQGNYTYHVKCDCGGEKYVSSYALRGGSTKSCGCAWKDAGVAKRGKVCKSQLVPEDVAFRHLLTQYISGARRNGREFCLTPEEFRALVGRPCLYCGLPPSTYHRPYLTKDGRPRGPHIAMPRAEGTYFIYTGVDRIDNARGYISDNVAPCCERCNRAKLTMPVAEFTEWLDRIAAFRGGGST